MNYPKRLIEVDLPIKRISAHARREKDMRRGHIPLLHIWWATRPPAACRAVICAALWPDPVDPNCPPQFRKEAAQLITQFAKQAATSKELAETCAPDTWQKWKTLAQPSHKIDPDNEAHMNVLRFALLDFIADFANWDNSTKKEYLEISRALTKAAHEALGGEPGTRPLVADPFAGGGAIPLEALRIGADAFASDLNPVAVLLNKVVLEYIPKYGQQLLVEVPKWVVWLKRETEKEMKEFYPDDADGSMPIAYLWARTITCEGPGCGTEVPLIRALWLVRKSKRTIGLRIIPNTKARRVDFEIVEGIKPDKASEGTVRRGSAICPVCGYTTPVASVRQQLKERNGGASDARLLCVVTTRLNKQGRFYRLPMKKDIEATNRAMSVLRNNINQKDSRLGFLPNEPTPQGGGSGAGRAFSQRNYGMNAFSELFTPRQALTLATMARLIREASDRLEKQYESGLATAVQVCLALILDKMADMNSSLCGWQPHAEIPAHVFTRQALQIVWDFAEANPMASSSGSPESSGKRLLDGISYLVTGNFQNGQAEIASADANPLPDDIASAFITDPPYYDAVPYADLSDFFYVWLKRTMPESVINSFTNVLTPKEDECIVDEVKGKDRKYFEKTMAQAMAEGRRVLHPSGIGIVVFAHKSTAGWEAQLQAMVDAGWTMTGSWAIDTEMGTRLRAQNSAALASSVHLVCRPRENSDGSVKIEIGDWRDVLQELPQRIHEWMPRLAAEGVVGADAIFACLGPALEVFSRYSRVEKASGEQVLLKEYLEYVWAAVAKEALNMIFAGADTTGFEEDARLTSMWLWTLSTGAVANGNESDAKTGESESDEADSKASKMSGFVLEYDAARKIAQGLGADLENLTHLVEVKGDKARLLPVSERTKYLFGKEESETPAKRNKKNAQSTLFDIGADESESGWGSKLTPSAGNTVLDRVHQSMILFAAGRSEALRRFLVDDGAGNDQRFWRLAQSLSALYPVAGDEKRWVDGVLARKKGLGF